MKENKKGEMPSFSAVIATIGAVLIAVGIAWLIAWNWSEMPDALKILILVVATASSLVAGVMLNLKDYPKIGASLIILGALLYSLSVFLVSQIFDVAITAQSTAFIFLICLVGVVLIALAFKSKTVGLIGCAEFIAFILAQSVALMDVGRTSSGGRIIVVFLFAVFGVITGFTAAKSLINHKTRIGPLIAIIAVTLFVSSFIPFSFGGGMSFMFYFVFRLLLYPAVIVGGIVWFVSSRKKKDGKKLDEEDEEDEESFSMEKDIYPAAGMLIAVILLGLILVLFSSITVQASAFIVLAFLVLTSIASYALESKGLVLFAILQLIFWIGVQIVSFEEENYFSLGMFLWLALSVIILLYGLMLVSKAFNHSFKEIFRGLSIWALVVFVFAFTFQEFLPNVWAGGFSAGGSTLTFAIIFSAISALAFIAGLIVALNKEAIDGKYALMCLMFFIFVPALLFSAVGVGDSGYHYGYGVENYTNIPVGLWFLWIFSNIVFILLILALIGEGTRQGSKALVNLGIIWFVIDIVSRYIGFMRDLWGYTSMAVIFIIGGIVLIIGGWGVEKWRRNLTQNLAQNTSTQN